MPVTSESKAVTKDPEPRALLPLGALMLAGLSTLAPVLAQEAAPPIKELSTVNVQVDADKPDGLRATTTRVGKVLQDPHDVPQAVTTITRTLMDQQQAGSLKEALRNVSGLTFNAAEGGRSGDNMNLRGFYTFGDMYLDGIRDTAQYNRETFNLDQLDVLRGAGAMLFGRGQAGGVINQVSKLPLQSQQTVLTGTTGSHGYREFKADLNQPLNANNAIRLNAMDRNEGSWRSNPVTGTQPELHRKGLALSVGFNLHTDNQFWINHYRLNTNDNPDYGVSFDPATRAPGTQLPASTFFGNARTFDRSDTTMTTVVNEYRIAPETRLRTQVRVAEYDRTYWAKTPSLTTLPDAVGGVGGNQSRVSHYRTVTLQSDYSRNFKAFGMGHELLAGFEYLKEDSNRNTLQNFGSVAVPDFRPWQGNPAAAPSVFTSNSYALYAQDTVEFVPQWKATFGLRRDQMNANYASATSPALNYGQNSTRTALSWHPTDETHYYIAASSSFSPTADLYQLTVTPLPPERSQVIELGAKVLLFEGDLALRAALYSATKNWERNADLESTAAILTKKRRTTGIELEAAGRITEHWEVFSGLALMDARILQVAENVNAATGAITLANPEYAGKRARNTPRYTFNLWSTYALTGQWKVGGGVEVKGDRQAVNPSGAGAVPTLGGVYHPNTAPAYARWDAMISYEQAQWALRLNIKNVFDKLYYDAVYDNGGFAVPGVRRLVTLTGEVKF